MGIQFCTESHKFVDFTLDCNVVVGDVLLGEGESFGYNLADLSIFNIDISSIGRQLGLGSDCLCCDGLSRWLCLSGWALVFEDVGSDDTVVGAGSLDLVERQVLLSCELLCVWAHEDLVT